jgi:hypothetical protein
MIEIYEIQENLLDGTRLFVDDLTYMYRIYQFIVPGGLFKDALLAVTKSTKP